LWQGLKIFVLKSLGTISTFYSVLSFNSLSFRSRFFGGFPEKQVVIGVAEIWLMAVRAFLFFVTELHRRY
jgi:hypothetical protein